MRIVRPQVWCIKKEFDFYSMASTNVKFNLKCCLTHKYMSHTGKPIYLQCNIFIQLYILMRMYILYLFIYIKVCNVYNCIIFIYVRNCRAALTTSTLTLFFRQTLLKNWEYIYLYIFMFEFVYVYIYICIVCARWVIFVRYISVMVITSTIYIMY